MDAEDIVRRDIERLNIANFSSPLGAEVASDRFTGERSWESNGKAPMKSRAKSEYSYLDKLHCVPNNRWSVEQQPSPDECHDSGVSLPLAISQASNLQYDGEQRMIDRSFGFLDQEGYSNIHGMRPHIFNCRSEPSIPPRLNMEPLSQVRPGYQEHNARPASIHISTQYSEHAIFNSPSGVGGRHGSTMFNDHVMYRSMESMFNHASKLGNTSEHTSDTTLSVPEEQHVTIDRDPKRGFGFTIRTATNLTSQDRVKIKEVKPDSPAASKGLIEGQILLQVNGKDIQELSFEEIVFLIHNEGNRVNLTVVPSQTVPQPPTLNDVVHEGYLQRQTKCGGIKLWNKQWVVVKRDGCLYYHKSRESQPSGMIVLPSFHYSKAVCANRKNVIKITRGSSVYLFAAHDLQEYEKWLQVLAEATKTQTLTLNHSIHNCALSALAIDNPLYSGWILKLKLSGFRAKRKWCVLKDNMMFFYYNIEDKKAHEVLCLTGYSCAATSVRDYKYCFALIPPTMKRWNSVLVFANENKHSYDRWYEKIRSVLDSTQLDNGAATAAAVAPPRTASSTPTTSPTPMPAGPLPGSPQLTLRSSAPSPDTREYYRKKDMKNENMYNFNTLVHTGDARPRSWHE